MVDPFKAGVSLQFERGVQVLPTISLLGVGRGGEGTDSFEDSMLVVRPPCSLTVARDTIGSSMRKDLVGLPRYTCHWPHKRRYKDKMDYQDSSCPSRAGMLVHVVRRGQSRSQFQTLDPIPAMQLHCYKVYKTGNLIGVMYTI